MHFQSCRVRNSAPFSCLLLFFILLNIYVIHQPGGPYWEKTVPDVLDTARGRRPRAVSKTEGTVFPNTDRPSAGE